MAEENRPVPGDPIKPGRPSGALPVGQVAAGAPPQAPIGPAPQDRSAGTTEAFSYGTVPRSEAERFLRWLAGLFLITGAGWGFIVLVGFLSVRLRIGISFSESAWVWGIL